MSSAARQTIEEKNEQKGGKNTENNYLLRPMTEADIEAVEAIDQEAFPQSLWGRATFLQNIANCYDLALVCVADEAGQKVSAEDVKATRTASVLGFAILRILGEEAELLLIAVDEKQRGKGIGKALLERLIALGRTRGARQLFLEVRAGNTPAICLYRGLGFQDIGLRRRYYHAPEEDALLMRKDMALAPDTAACEKE